MKSNELTEIEICAIFGINPATWLRWQHEGCNAVTVAGIQAWLDGKPGSVSNALTAFVQLPATAQAVADVIGRDATLLLCHHAKHRCLYVPIKKSRALEIIALIGEPAFNSLHRNFAGSSIPLPRCPNLLRIARNAAIQRAYVNGVSIPRIALAFNVSKRLVFRAVAIIRNNGTLINKNATLILKPDISSLRIGSSRRGEGWVAKQAQNLSSHRPKKHRVTSQSTARARSNQQKP